MQPNGNRSLEATEKRNVCRMVMDASDVCPTGRHIGPSRRPEGPEAKRSVVGVDIAKCVFQVLWVEVDTGETKSGQLTRERFLEHFAMRAPCLVGMEACGRAQHWARELGKLGHEVRLLSARSLRPLLGSDMNEVADARAIWAAVQQPGIKAVAVKHMNLGRLAIIAAFTLLNSGLTAPGARTATALYVTPIGVSLVHVDKFVQSSAAKLILARDRR
jgi:hypothetical protein